LILVNVTQAFRHISCFAKFGNRLRTFYVKIRMPPSYIVSKTVLSKMYVVFQYKLLCQTFRHPDKYLAKSAQVALKNA